jgi:SAM-dependent methyltransferase
MYNSKFYEIFYYRLFSNAIVLRQKDTILGSIYAKIMKWPEIVQIQNGKYSLLLPRSYAKIQINEYDMWKKWYGNNFDGMTVLDVGAGAGETASFFFNHGAKKVIAFEINHLAIDYLWKNAQRNNWNIAIYGREFTHFDLAIPHDYSKFDIEGGEKILLKYKGELGKCSMELHPEVIGKRNVQLLIERFGLQPIMKPRVWGIA